MHIAVPLSTNTLARLGACGVLAALLAVVPLPWSGAGDRGDAQQAGAGTGAAGARPYRAFLSEPLTGFSNRTGQAWVEAETVTEMLNELVAAGREIESIHHVPEARLGGDGEFVNRVLVITRD